MLRWSGALAVAMVLSACVTNPHHGKNVGPKSTPVRFDIWATVSNAALSITCSSHYGSPVTIATFTGGSTPTTLGSETVYARTHTMVIPDDCWESWSGSGYNFITYIRVKQATYNAAVFDTAGLDCLYDAINDGTGPITAGYNCKRSGADILLYAN